MKAVVRSIISPDADLPSFVPADPRRVGLFVQVLFGPADGPGEESLDLMVCTPQWLETYVAETGPAIGRHFLIVPGWDYPRIAAFVTHAVESEQAPTWLELGQRLSRIGGWEFEDYRE